MKMNVKKTEKDGIVRAYPENGKPLAWSASSGVELIEKDGLYFKDLEKTGFRKWHMPRRMYGKRKNMLLCDDRK